MYNDIDPKTHMLSGAIMFQPDSEHYISYVLDVSTNIWWSFDSYGRKPPRQLVYMEVMPYGIILAIWVSNHITLARETKDLKFLMQLVLAQLILIN